ncbi:MAG TPA: hypothetical protein VMJ10_29105, partial [Kofleriaceae bacterium]|nr:hypothetical protein [Kofleriaceae bacterium]
TDVAVDGLGNVYIADEGNNRIREVTVDGTMHTVAGTGANGFGGDGGPATKAVLSYPYNLGLDPQGRLIIVDYGNSRLRRVEADGTIDTIAGNGTGGYTGDGGPATSAELNYPGDIDYDHEGRLVFADYGNSVVRRIDTSGVITTIAGTGAFAYSGDGGPATSAALYYPYAVAVDASDRVLIADSLNNRIRMVDTAGIITTIAGTGVAGFGGDGGPAVQAVLDAPSAVAIDGQGRVLLVDESNSRVRAIATDGTISTIVGSTNVPGDGLYGYGDAIDFPSAVVYDSQDRLLYYEDYSVRVRRIGADGTLSTIAGDGSYSATGDGGPATAAGIGYVGGMAYDAQGALYITDNENNVLRRVDTNGTITTIAGTGTAGYSGDGGPATSAMLNYPNGIAIDAQGRILFADYYNARVRRIDTTSGNITTIAGSGAAGYSGDGAAATSAALNGPSGVAVDATGRILIADTNNHRIRRIDTTGVITTIAGTGAAGYSGDGAAATAATLNGPSNVKVDAQGRILIADANNNAIRRIDAGGTITTIAGTGAAALSGDGGPATSASLQSPLDVASDAAGKIAIADANNEAVREIDPQGTIVTVAGQVEPDGMGPVANGHLADGQQLALGTGLTFVAGGSSGTLQLVRDGADVEVVAGRYLQTTPTGSLARFRDTTFGSVGGVAFDAARNLVYLSETSNNRIDVVTIVDPANASTWTIAPLANTAGTAGYADGAAATAKLDAPAGLFLDTTAHVLYIADSQNHAIRALDLSAMTISTVAGIATLPGDFGDGQPALAAALYRPTAVTRCANGDMFIADTGNERVRKVSAASSTMSTVLGDGSVSSAGEGKPAVTFPVDTPLGIACDQLGNVIVSSMSAVRLLAADDNGVVDGMGSVLTIYGAPPRDTFPANATSCLTGVVVVDATTLRLADSCTGLLVQLHRM